MPVTLVKSTWSAGSLVFTDSAGNVVLRLDGTSPTLAGAATKHIVNLGAATQALTAAMTGQRFVGAVDAVFTLPAVAVANTGVSFTFECGALSAGTGLKISPAAADYIGGNNLSITANKGLINDGATDRLGDSVRIYSNGTTGWIIEAIIGTWSKEA